MRYTTLILIALALPASAQTFGNPLLNEDTSRLCSDVGIDAVIARQNPALGEATRRWMEDVFLLQNETKIDYREARRAAYRVWPTTPDHLVGYSAAALCARALRENGR